MSGNQLKHAVLAAVVLVGLLLGVAGAAVTPNDAFEGTAVDTSRWHISTTPDASAAVSGGHLVLTAGPSTSDVEPSANLFSTWRLSGPFDVQVDFTLLAWPDHPYASIGLEALPPDDYCTVERAVIDLTGTGSADQCYLTNFYPFAGGELVTSLTTDQSGKLRLVRDAGGIITGYRWDTGTSEWVVISPTTAHPGDVTIRLFCVGGTDMATQVAFDNFTVNQGEVAEPAIDDLSLTYRKETDEQGRVHHSVTLQAEISDPEGLSDIASIAVTDPLGDTYTALPGERPYPVRWCREDDNTAFVCWEIPYGGGPPTGAYTVTLTDAAGNTCAETPAPDTTIVAPVRLTHPEPDSFGPSVAPTFTWEDITVGWPVTLDLIEEGTGSIWTTDVTFVSTIDYNADGEALRPELQSGRNYSWSITAAVDSAPTRVRERWEAVGRARFALSSVEQSLPVLPGKLAYTTVSDPGWEGSFTAVMQYTPGTIADVDVPPDWLTANGMEIADWSPDGTTLLLGDWGHTYLDHLDGSGPVEIPGVYGGDQRWSPDGAQIVYTSVGQPAAFMDDNHDIWAAGIDGSDPHAVVTHDSNDRYPAWSPDGEWISYRREPDPEGQFTWMVHPDGTDDHALLGTGVEGYPGYTVWALGNATWSPDATRLAVGFEANPPAGTDLPIVAGIGVIAREGGVVLPVFVTPSGVVCCAGPKLPLWSPDGTKIAFVSGHHLPVNPAWADGAFETGDELWMINANGSGEPTRLTYDHSFEDQYTWWAPLVFPDVPHGHWAYNAINTCNQAGVVVGYWDGYRPDNAVTRDQMAVYIARALAGGEENVPTGPSTPTFPDVGADHWAYRHIEYVASDEVKVVEGFPGGNYKPDLVVSRGQMAVYIARSLVTPTGDAAIPEPPAAPTFPDVTAENDWSWCYPHVEYLAAQGVVNGYWDGYRPAADVTRDQMAVYIARAFRLPM